MVGGDEIAVNKVWPLLSTIGQHVVRAGPSGNGSLCKLLNNFVATWNMLGVSQAFILAEKFGLPAERLYTVMAQSSGNSYSLERNYTRITQKDFSSSFSLELGKKDMFLALDLAAEADLHLIPEDSIRNLFEHLIEQGCSQMDLSYIHMGVERMMSNK